MAIKRQQSDSLYRHLLSDAWRITSGHPHLWVYGFFAAVISTGGIADVLTRATKQVDATAGYLAAALNGSFAGSDLFGSYVQLILTVPSYQLSILIALFIAFLLGIFLFAVHAQVRLTEELLGKKRSHVYWRALELALLTKAAFAVLAMLTSLALTYLMVRGTEGTFAYFVVFLLFFPCVIIMSIVSALALADMVKAGTHSLQAIENAWRIFTRHALITFELGVLLFFAIFSAGVIAFAIAVAFMFPYSLLQIAAAQFGNPLLTVGLHLFGAFLLLALAAVFLAITTTFQYACWVCLYERATKRVGAGKMRAKLLRAIKAE